MEIITVKMTDGQQGSPDGIVVRNYEKGCVYNLPSDLADAFVDMKCAKKIKKNQKAQVDVEGQAVKLKVETPEKIAVAGT